MLDRWKMEERAFVALGIVHLTLCTQEHWTGSVRLLIWFRLEQRTITVS